MILDKTIIQFSYIVFILKNLFCREANNNESEAARIEAIHKSNIENFKKRHNMICNQRPCGYEESDYENPEESSAEEDQNTEQSESNPSTSGDSGKMIDAINEYRKEQGLQPMEQDEKLDAAAQVQSDHMAQENAIGHTGPPGQESLSQRVDKQGGEGMSARENVAQVNNDYMEALPLWKKSPGHNKNLLADSKKCGVGQTNGEGSKIYVAQVATN
ncbi:hypothetical protein GVAV_001459 [Gurleya vavrai]